VESEASAGVPRGAAGRAVGRVAAIGLIAAAALAWAEALRFGGALGAMLLGARGLPGDDGLEFVAVTLLAPLVTLPLGILAAAAGVLWERRWALGAALAAALASAGHLVFVAAVWRRMLG
jgi:hypothetical protein